MPDYGLSAQQIAVICALSSGVNMTAAAEQAGVHRNTIANWRRNSLPFQQGFAHAQYDRALYYREKIENLVDLAIDSIQQILTDPKAPPSVKLKAALAIMTLASTPPAPKKQVELDIEKIVLKRTPPETVTPDQLEPAPPISPKDAQPITHKAANSPTPAHKDAQSEPEPDPPSDAQSTPQDIFVNSRPFAANSQTQVHKDAQPTPQNIRVNSCSFVANSSTPRNAKCPCGSGRKYKRCCKAA
jgi:hypothetical protein